MNEKVPELLDLTKKLLDQSMEIVDDSVPSSESVPAEEVQYSIFLRVQMSEALKFGYGAYHSCKHGWDMEVLGRLVPYTKFSLILNISIRKNHVKKNAL